MSGVKDFNVPFKDVLANITAGLDVDVYYKELGHSFGKVHVNIVSESLNKRQWLIDTTYANHHENQRYVNYINSNYNRLRYIYHNGKIVGLAALNTLYQQHSSYMDIHTVGASGSNIDDLKKKDLGEAVYVLPKEYFSPKVFDSREVFLTPETHAIHHYQNSWFSHKAFAYYRTRTLFIKIFGYKAVRSLEKMLLKR